MMSDLNGTTVNDTTSEDFADTNDDQLGEAARFFKWLENYGVRIGVICIILAALGKCTYFILKFP